MKYMTKRNLLLFFRDRAGMIFSLLGVIIIFALFVFFVGDSVTEGLDFLPNARHIMNLWLISGMLASAGITTSMGAYSIMVSDKEHKRLRDFVTSPLSQKDIVGSYMLSGIVISLIMTVLTLLFSSIYIYIKDERLFSVSIALKTLGVVFLSSFSSSAMICFIISFIKSSNSYTTVSIILGTAIGFLVGAYIPFGEMPSVVQSVVKFFPCAHAAALFRTVLMGDEIVAGFSNLPVEAMNEFKETLGITFSYGGRVAEPWIHIAVLAASGVIFYALAIIVRKSQRTEI